MYAGTGSGTRRPKSLETVGQTLLNAEKSTKGTTSRSLRTTKSKSKDLDPPSSPPSDRENRRDSGLGQGQNYSPTYVADIPALPYRLKSCQFDEGEERVYVAIESWQSDQVQNLITALLDWMNDVLAAERIVLTDLIEDLYDGLILRKLLERLLSDVVDFSDSSPTSPLLTPLINKEDQVKRLKQILTKSAEILGPALLWDHVKWTAEAMRNKNAIVIIQISVALAIYFQAPIAILRRRSSSDQQEQRCQIRALLVKKRNCHLYGRLVDADLIPALDGVLAVSGGGRGPGPGQGAPSNTSIRSPPREQRDAFDTLFDHAPEKLNSVTKSIVAFVNGYLNKLNNDIRIVDVNAQFRDGVNLILLIGMLENYFVPLYKYNPRPSNDAEKLENVRVAFGLLEDAGIGGGGKSLIKSTPEDIVSGDPKSVLRILFVLYNRYHHRV